MNRDEKLIDTLILSTEKQKTKWRTEDWINSSYINESYPSTSALTLSVGGSKEVVLLKYEFMNGEEKVDLLLFNKVKGLNSPVLVIEQDDLNQPHRLWTLYKLADRSASGADKMIDDIISELSDDGDFPF